MNRSDSVKELASALAKAQGEMQNPKFDTVNPFFKSNYASLASVRNTVIPIFAKNGLSIIQSLRSTEKGVECETMLLHSSGEWVSDTLSLPIVKHDPQGYGSAATYARRYSLMSFSGVVGDADDDANAASDLKGKPKATAQQEQASVAASDGKPLSPSQERLIRAKLSSGGIKEEDFTAKYPDWCLTPKEGKILVPKAEVNNVLAWIEGQKI